MLFGLSGTGKTTLSADPKRELVGDDEHVWTDTGIFNIEGGCYAKAINLSRENEPQIFDALRFGSVLENVRFDPAHHHVDFDDTSITQNTRGAYPIEYIDNARIPCVAGHPRDIIFLTCDAFGVLPPVSRLTPEQAMYHFISGYTAKVAGTEMGVTEPEATFSPCFGGPFLVWHPGKYAELLAAKMKQHDTNVWLVNTGWAGGGYGKGAPDQARLHPRHRRCDPRGQPGGRADAGRSGVRYPHRDESRRGVRRTFGAPQQLVRLRSLRRGGRQTCGFVYRKLQTIRRGGERRGQCCRAKR